MARDGTPTASIVSRWARKYVLAAALAGVAWQLAALAGAPRRTEVTLGLLGFVLLTVFGKAYSLVPTYFDRELAVPRAPAVQWPLVVGGVAALAVDSLASGSPDPDSLAASEPATDLWNLVPEWLGAVGALSWSLGVAAFLGTLLWTIRSNLSGAETATGANNEERRPVDRLANGFVPLALAYLAVGTYAVAAPELGLPPLFDGYPPRATHLLAAGTATLLLFALGFRLLPRFLVAQAPRWLVAVVLPAGAIGPVVLAGALGSGSSLLGRSTSVLGDGSALLGSSSVVGSSPWLVLGGVLQGVAVIGFAVAYAVLFARSDKRRVGFYGVLLGVVAGVLAVSIGLWMALDGWTSALVLAHLRLNLLGFLATSIAGVAFQFYPPAIGQWPGASDRAALGALGALASGAGLQALGLLLAVGSVTVAGEVVALAGAATYCYLLAATVAAR